MPAVCSFAAVFTVLLSFFWRSYLQFFAARCIVDACLQPLALFWIFCHLLCVFDIIFRVWNSQRSAMLSTGSRYSRDLLLSLYTPTAPAHDVIDRIRKLGLWTPCRLDEHSDSRSVYLRRYRGNHAGRGHLLVAKYRSVGNGAFVVTTSTSRRRRPLNRQRGRTLIDITQTSSANVPTRQLTFGSLNIRSLANKTDDLLEVRRDHGIDVLCLVETWHDADFVCFRRLRTDSYQIVDRPCPRSQSESGTLLTNHGVVAIVSVPGVRTSAINLGVNPTSLELVCACTCDGRVVVVYHRADLPAWIGGSHDVVL